DESPWSVPATVHVTLPPQYVCGDLTGNGGTPNVADLTYFVNFLFRGGPPPADMAAADIDGSGGLPTVGDLTYFIGFLFRGGPPPICENGRHRAQ
ncbi:MAG TPA: hypothetical protein PKY95_08175, partial [candidate division Zixibacteria bacterium]|nr:hypothetical protein [candidate division Zixibacteria bacterium]